MTSAIKPVISVPVKDTINKKEEKKVISSAPKVEIQKDTAIKTDTTPLKLDFLIEEPVENPKKVLGQMPNFATKEWREKLLDLLKNININDPDYYKNKTMKELFSTRNNLYGLNLNFQYGQKSYSMEQAIIRLKHDHEIISDNLVKFINEILTIYGKIQFLIKSKLDDELLNKVQFPEGVNNLKELLAKIKRQVDNIALVTYKLYHFPTLLTNEERSFLLEFFSKKDLDKKIITYNLTKIEGLNLNRIMNYIDAKYETSPSDIEKLREALKKLFSSPQALNGNERLLLNSLVGQDLVKYLIEGPSLVKGARVMVNGTWYEISGKKGRRLNAPGSFKVVGGGIVF